MKKFKEHVAKKLNCSKKVVAELLKAKNTKLSDLRRF